jgi:hypothetical protein
VVLVVRRGERWRNENAQSLYLDTDESISCETVTYVPQRRLSKYSSIVHAEVIFPIDSDRSVLDCWLWVVIEVIGVVGAENGRAYLPLL